MPRRYRSGALWGYDCVTCGDFIVGKPDATGECEHCKSKTKTKTPERNGPEKIEG